MNYVDLIILALIIIGAFIGFRRGFTRELVEFVGFIVCIIIAFLMKNTLSAILYEHLPFFSIGGIFKGIVAINILVYEVLSFLIVLSLLLIILGILKFVTKIFERILKMTIILGIPSKILGAILGGAKWIVISYAVLFIMALPVFNTNYLNDSIICKSVLRYTPVLSNITNKSLDVFNEFNELKNKYKTEEDTNAFNLESLDLLLKYGIINIDVAERLYQKGKFKSIKNVEIVLAKYRKGNTSKVDLPYDVSEIDLQNEVLSQSY